MPHYIDAFTEKEINNKEGFKGFLIKSISTINQMSVFAYAIEVYFVHKVSRIAHLYLLLCTHIEIRS